MQGIRAFEKREFRVQDGIQILKILHVEDEASVLNLVKQWLSAATAPRFEVLQAESLDGAFQALQSEAVDCVLLNLTLPDSLGADTFISFHSRHPFLPVVIFSGTAAEQASLHCMQKGAQDYLLKGRVTESELVRSLCYAVHRKRAEENTIRKTQERLDELVHERTQELRRTNEILRSEMKERKRRNEEMRRVNRTLKILSAANLLIVSAKEEKQFLNDICRLIVDAGGFRLAWVGFAVQDEEKSVVPVAQAGYEDGYLDTLNVTWSEASERGRGPTGISTRTGRPVVCVNILKDPSFEPWRAEALRRGYASSVALPLNDGGDVTGTINIYSEDADAFHDEEVKLLEELAVDISFGVKTVRARSAHEQTMETLRETYVMLEAVLNSSPVGIAALDEEGRVKLWSHGAETMFGFAREEVIGNMLPIVPAENKDEHKILRERVLRGDGFSGKEVRRLRKDGTVLDISLSTAPLRDAKGKETGVVGVLLDITERKRATEALSQLNEQLRALAARLQSAQEEEAKRIAREIHDEMGQLLTGINIHLAYLEKTIKDDDEKRKMLEELEALQNLSTSLIQTVRRIASELRPSVLDDLGLVSAVEWQAQEFEARTKIKCRLELPGEDISLEAGKATALYRILQEALTNVARHSGAAKVDVTLEHRGARILLEVRDNGRGISGEKIRQNSLGILGMRERAALFGGVVELIGLEGQGTIVRAEMPC